MIHPSAKVIVRSFHEKNVLFLVRRSINGRIYYEPAGGRIEYNFESRTAESFEQCAVREVKEELNAIIDIGNYLGSYHFFWDSDPKNLSICTVFEGILKEIDLNSITKGDTCGIPMEPAWVSVLDILSGKILINPGYVGLEEIILSYCRSISSENILSGEPAVVVRQGKLINFKEYT